MEHGHIELEAIHTNDEAAAVHAWHLLIARARDALLKAADGGDALAERTAVENGRHDARCRPSLQQDLVLVRVVAALVDTVEKDWDAILTLGLDADKDALLSAAEALRVVQIDDLQRACSAETRSVRLTHA